MPLKLSTTIGKIQNNSIERIRDKNEFCFIKLDNHFK